MNSRLLPFLAAFLLGTGALRTAAETGAAASAAPTPEELALAERLVLQEAERRMQNTLCILAHPAHRRQETRPPRRMLPGKNPLPFRLPRQRLHPKFCKKPPRRWLP